MNPSAYAMLLRQARRYSRRPDEAEDLLHTVLLSALRAGRTDLACPQNRRWLHGALRKRSAHEARTALRRRAREAGFEPPTSRTAQSMPEAFLADLPPALKRTARLVLSGHSRPEIRHVLRLSDAALRQRLTQISRRWQQTSNAPLHTAPDLAGALPYGLLRRALVPAVRHAPAHLGSHDPDGHLFVLGAAHKNLPHGNLLS